MALPSWYRLSYLDGQIENLQGEEVNINLLKIEHHD